MLLLALACGPTDIGPFQRATLPTGAAVGDSGWVDTAEAAVGWDSAALGDSGEDTAAGADTAETTPAGVFACYLGPARDYSLCLPVVDYDAGLFGGDYDYPDASSGGESYNPPERFLDLSAHSTELEIAPNFALGEYLQEWKGRYGVMQGHVVDRLQDIRDHIGEPLTVNSGYRNPAYNTSIGGADWSRHMWGDAADIQSSNYSVEALGTLCEDLGADYVGLYEDGHTHCDWRYAAADTAFYGSVPAGPVPAETATLVVLGPVLTAPAVGFDEGEPLRRWTAFDASGSVLITTTGRDFAPPSGAAWVHVRIGGRVTLVHRTSAPP